MRGCGPHRAALARGGKRAKFKKNHGKIQIERRHRADKEETGYHCPLATRLGSGERRKLDSPSGVRGSIPAENRFYAYLRWPESSYLQHFFSVFLNDGGGPKHCGARENFPSFPLPLDGPAGSQNLRRKGDKFDHRTVRPKVLLRHWL